MKRFDCKKTPVVWSKRRTLLSSIINFGGFFVILKRKYSKTFLRRYTVISTLVEVGKTRNLVKTLPLRPSCFHAISGFSNAISVD